MIPTLIAALNAATNDFVNIQHALEIEPVDDLSTYAPACFLMEGDGKGLDEQGDSCVDELEAITVVSVIVCKWADLDTLKAQSREVIRGYQHGQYYTPFLLTSSVTVKIKGEYIWRKEIFTATKYH